MSTQGIPIPNEQDLLALKNENNNNLRVLEERVTEQLAQKIITADTAPETQADGGIWFALGKTTTDIESTATLLEIFADTIDGEHADLKIAFITDTHNTSNFPSMNNENYLHARNVAELSHIIDIDAIIHGGDLAYDYVGISDFTKDSMAVVNELNHADCPILITQGNHDTNDYYAFKNGADINQIISPDRWANTYAKNVDAVFGDASKSYYYKDFEKQKVRIVVLNTHDAWVLDAQNKPKYNRSEPVNGTDATYAISNTQLQWLANVALNFNDNDYTIIIVSHARLIDTNIINADVALKVIKARRTRTTYTSAVTTGDFGQSVSVDYTNANKVDVVCCLNGHRHIDEESVVDGTRFITIASDRDPVDNRINNEAWDVLCLDKVQRQLKIKRFGTRGEDRIFEY